MKVINIDPAADHSKKHKEDLLEVLDTMRSMVEKGQIDEFVSASVNSDGEVQIHAGVKDTLGAVGLFSIGQSLLIERQLGE